MNEKFEIIGGKWNREPNSDKEWTEWITFLLVQQARTHAECCLKRIHEPAVREELAAFISNHVNT